MANEKRLIDANAFLKALNERPYDFLDVCGDFGYFDETIDSVMNEQPTVDAVEVVHGRWQNWHYDPCEDCYVHVCSKCGGTNERMKPYCPNCGAKMDGERRTDNERMQGL